MHAGVTLAGDVRRVLEDLGHVPLVGRQQYPLVHARRYSRED